MNFSTVNRSYSSGEHDVTDVVHHHQSTNTLLLSTTGNIFLLEVEITLTISPSVISGFTVEISFSAIHLFLEGKHGFILMVGN